MEQNLRFYVAKSIELAKTITIKSEQLARAYNEGIKDYGLIADPHSPETWKYYMTLAGQYHETHTLMTVKSLDTLETIEFTVNELKNHRATREAYQYGTSYHKELVTRYPDQEPLIYHILNPIDKYDSIAAEDGTILAFPTALVDPNETDLISRLEAWIKRFMHRWNTRAYSITDELYSVGMMGVLWMTLPQVIFVLRLENMGTARAHGFHIRETLASHQNLDEFYDLLTLDQRLFLYRNLDYIIHNAGHQETFDMLLDNILTDRGISLVQYDLRQNHSDVPDTSLVPTADLLATNVNFKERNVHGFPESIADLMEKQIPLAYGNRDKLASAIEETHYRTELGLSTQYLTKTFEARAEDISARYEISLEEMLINHWLYFSAHGWYQATIPVTNPITAMDQSLLPGEAFVMYFYCYMRTMGVEMPVIPTLLANNVQKHALPTLTQAELWYGGEDYRLPMMLDRFTPHYTLFDNLTFGDRVGEIHQAYLNNTWLYKQEEDHRKNGALRQVLGRCLQNVEVNLFAGEDYKAWLLDRGVDVDEFKRYDFQIFADEIFTNFTGLTLSKKDNVRRVLNAMVGVMSRLSSYNVHYLELLENDNFINLDWVTSRLSNTRYMSEQSNYLETSSRLKDARQQAHGSVEAVVGSHVKFHRVDSRTKHRLDTSLHLKTDAQPDTLVLIPQPEANVLSVTVEALT